MPEYKQAFADTLIISPAAAAVMYTFLGMPVHEIAAWLTVIYMTCLILEKVATWINKWKMKV